MTVRELLVQLESESIHTWFDLGLFIDRVREKRNTPSAEFLGYFEDFREFFISGGIAFITFGFGIDGVTIETGKYAEAFRNILPGVPIHYIAGEIRPEGGHLIHKSYKRRTIEEISGFSKWPLYRRFFLTKLERGSQDYNALIHDFWNEVLLITKKLGEYLEKHGIKLLYLLNVCSNPGNVSLSLAVVLISEFLGIPVINNCHDFYWEEGNREVDIRIRGLRQGPRDLFFTNSDVGEFFSVIDVLFPWESRSWITVNINRNQCRRVVEQDGHNPANVSLINTAIDLRAFREVSKQEKMKALNQIADILSHYTGKFKPIPPERYLKSLREEGELSPVLIGRGTFSFKDFVHHNIIFLQPTRIMSRKRIEIGFTLIRKLFMSRNFASRFQQNLHLHLTLLITGPIAGSHREYFRGLIAEFSALIDRLPEEMQGRVNLAFLFSEFDTNRFIEKYKRPLSIPDIYSFASLILLPSETEGRGLPIIEAAASGVPIFCHRYHPRRVFREVIGQHLQESDRLHVLAFKGDKVTKGIVKKVAKYVLSPQAFAREKEQNQSAVNKRFSMESLEKNIADIYYLLYTQLKPNAYSLQRAAEAIREYRWFGSHWSESLKHLLRTEHRHYLPGDGRLAFMHFLKSLIDPSYFRVEEQRIRGMAMSFAEHLVNTSRTETDENRDQVIRFYNAVDNLFLYQQGEVSIRHDHSFAYRHRSKKYFPYQDFTFQELTGLINLLCHKILSPSPGRVLQSVLHLFTDKRLALFQLTNSQTLAIDQRDRLLSRMKDNVPVALFPGDSLKYELDFFVLQRLRDLTGIREDEDLQREEHRDKLLSAQPVYIFCSEKPLGERVTADRLREYLSETTDRELKFCYKMGLCRIIKTKQWCVGIHFPQMGKPAIEVLRKIQKEGGFMISADLQAPIMTDIVQLDRFHVGAVHEDLFARIMGIPKGSGYIQFVPAGIRTTLAFPTPVQTALDFDQALKGPLYRQLVRQLGETKVLSRIRADAETQGSPIESVLHRISEDRKSDVPKSVEYSYVSGVYPDHFPYNGAVAWARVSRSKDSWGFTAVSAGNGRKQVTTFASEFEKSSRKKVRIAWNGGYILNAELVGKLGLPDSYIGSPLGLVMSGGKVLSPPLFNKPALLISTDGGMDIRRINCRKGITVSAGGSRISFLPEGYNNRAPEADAVCYYDLLYSEDFIPGDGRICIRLSGCVIKEIIRTGEDVPVVPVGLVLSFPSDRFPVEFDEPEKKLNIRMNGWQEVSSAIEAGPMLVQEGEVCLDMETEGWKSSNSIKTQAARLDFTDMRGPKIAVGLDGAGDLAVLTINGRIRESVGATHGDMADLLISRGIQKAMGFDPGGSSTLVVDGKVLTISPYNSSFEEDVLSLPPEPRPVGNAVLGWQSLS